MATITSDDAFILELFRVTDMIARLAPSYQRDAQKLYLAAHNRSGVIGTRFKQLYANARGDFSRDLTGDERRRIGEMMVELGRRGKANLPPVPDCSFGPVLELRRALGDNRYAMAGRVGFGCREYDIATYENGKASPRGVRAQKIYGLAVAFADALPEGVLEQLESYTK